MFDIGSNFETLGDVLGAGEGVVSGDGDVLRDVRIETLAIMNKRGCLAVENLACHIDSAAKAVNDALPAESASDFQPPIALGDSLPHAHPQYGYLPTEMLYGCIAYTSILLRVARAWTYD
jgi:hypothetical protein